MQSNYIELAPLCAFFGVGRTLVLAELKNAYPRSVPFRHLLQQLRFESKAALNRLLYKMLEQKDIRRARVSPPMWTLFSTPAGESYKLKCRGSLDLARNAMYVI